MSISEIIADKIDHELNMQIEITEKHVKCGVMPLRKLTQTDLAIHKRGYLDGLEEARNRVNKLLRDSEE